MHDGFCRVASESNEREEVSRCVLDLPECLLGVYSSWRA